MGYQTLFDTIPEGLNYNVTGWLVYDDAAPLPAPTILDTFNPLDDIDLVPYDKQPLLPPPDQVIELDVIMDNLDDGANYAFFNNITYKSPSVPTLYTALTAPSDELAQDPAIYGEYTHSFVLQKGQIVQIVVNNLDTGRHPFHLHGHQFQAVYRGAEDSGTFADAAVSESSLPAVPMRRDTLVVWPTGNIVLRFRADNPGVWLFHCHIEWHVTSGLMATMVEAPAEMREGLSLDALPKNHLDACKAGGVAVQGNAAGNDVDFLDLRGEPTPPGPLPDGFTTSGIIALVFSCISGILGTAVIAWYGFSNPAAKPSMTQISAAATAVDAKGGVSSSAVAASGDGASGGIGNDDMRIRSHGDENGGVVLEDSVVAGSGKA